MKIGEKLQQLRKKSGLTQEQLDYVIAAVKALYEDRESIPNMRIVWGHKLPMRHFHAFLEPYPNGDPA